MRALWAVLCAGCSPAAIVVEIPPPPGNAQSEILAVVSVDDPVVIAHDLSMPALSVPIEFDEAASVSLEAHLFQRSLASFGASEGRLLPGMTPLPPPDAVYGINVKSSGASAWAPLSAASLADYRFAGASVSPCRDLSAWQALPLSNPGWLAGFVQLDATSALALTTGPRAYRVTMEGATEIFALPALEAPQRMTRGADGRIYLTGGLHGFVGTLETGFVEMPRPPMLLRAIVAPLSAKDEPAELYALGDDFSLLAFEDGRWSTLGRAGTSTTSNNLVLGMAWVGPREVLAENAERTAIYAYRDGSVTVDDFDGAGEAVTAIDSVPGFGTFLGLASGDVYQRVGTRWDPYLRASTMLAAVGVFAPFGGGLLIGGEVGTLRQYYPSFGECEVTYFGPYVELFAIAHVDGGLLVAGQTHPTELSREMFLAAVDLPSSAR